MVKDHSDSEKGNLCPFLFDQLQNNYGNKSMASDIRIFFMSDEKFLLV